MGRNEMADLADRLVNEGDFELYLDNHTRERSKRVWLTERERDAIVAALYAAAEPIRFVVGTPGKPL